jgi:hypothetical protein
VDYDQLMQAASGKSQDEIKADVESSGKPVRDAAAVAAFLTRCAEDPDFALSQYG